MPEQLQHPILAGHKALIVGIANEHSIAYGCARAFRELGAELAITYLNDKARVYVEPLAKELGSQLLMPLDVSKPGQLEAVFQQIEQAWGSCTPWCIPSPLHPRTICRGGWSTALPRVLRSLWTSPATPSSAWPDSQSR